MSRRLALALLALIALSAVRLPAQDYRAQALRILRTTPLIDGHNDIPDAIRERGGLDSVDFAVLQPRLMTDIPKLRAGGVGAQFWAAYVPVTTIHEGTHPAVYALEQIDLVHRLCARYPGTLAEARTAAEIERNFRAGKISCLIGIEGGHAIENSLGALRSFYDLGVRYMTLTHWETIDWADAATDSASHDGLTAFGEQVVLEMNRLGMLVDLSHVADATMMDALRVSRAPVFYSHSSARALANHVRNVPDSILRLVGQKGGVVMVNFNPGFVSEAVRLYGDSVQAWARALRAAGGGGGGGFRHARRFAQGLDRAGPQGHAPAGGGPYRAHPRRRRRGSRGARLGLRRHQRRAGGARGRLEVPRSLGRAAAPRVERDGCAEGRGAECAAGAAGSGTGERAAKGLAVASGLGPST